ncbi:unnamed protein product [Aphanomyces euteiches]|uniref:CASTOR/POLLUX/SYM8 ion channel conserved domain-containing protein n=1 Tax=Aphanomyces euteiches TaxID=100861 RepID=A0A6G0XB87_9STRA|nr:hypothetical protein Ae201684_006547 [Aphanomyces euteiches]KAH9157591.1 hypothetical protein AeRB84_000590 [Aphanomyces euteiches]
MTDVKVVPTNANKYAVNESSASLLSHSGSSTNLVTKSSMGLLGKKKAAKKRSYTYHALLAYKINTFISTRRGQTITLVTFGSVFTLVMAGIIYAIHDVSDSHFDEALWDAWMYMTFPGAQREAHGWKKRGIAMVVTIIGILFFAVNLGFVVDSVREKMDSLKKGKSQIVEDNHTLLLGWTDKSIYLIREICRANESEKGGVIVVLAELEKEHLEAELHSQMHVDDLLGTKVVFRSGNPLLIVDLLKVSAHTARSIVIMASLGDADKSDASVLRIILSLLGLPSLRGHVVAEVRDIDNEPLIALVGGGAVETLVSHDVIGRLVIMSARSPGLAKVFSAVLGFAGNEFYISAWPTCVGVPFSQLQERFESAIPIGIEKKDGEIEIKPPPDRLIEAGESIVFLAEDNDTYKAAETPIVIPPVPDHPPVTSERQLEKILMCGWRRDIRDMIKLLDELVLHGSEVHLLCEDPPIDDRDRQLVESGLDLNTLENIELIHQFGNSAIRRHVDMLPLEEYTSVMVLGDQSRETDILHSDSHSLSTVLLIRGLQSARKKRAKQRLLTERVANAVSKWVVNLDQDHSSQCPCITEILDPRTQKTISSNKTIARHSEFIQSNELVSCMLAMIAESRKVKKILNELLGATGCSFQVEQSSRYCDPSELLSFYQVAKRAMVHDEVLCGYQTRVTSDGTVLNPPDKNKPRSWKDMDFVIIRDRKDQDKKRELVDKGAEAFQDAGRHHHVAELLDSDRVMAAGMDDIDEAVDQVLSKTAENEHVVQVTREVLQRLAIKLSVILKECHDDNNKTPSTPPSIDAR